jgi:hypothetical protein
VGGDRGRRLAIATTEREVARIETQRAARLRDRETTYGRGEPLPKLLDEQTARLAGPPPLIID